MSQILKSMAIISISLLSMQSFSADELHPGHGRNQPRVIQGEVIYGRTMSCELWNDSHRAYRVLSYSYNVWYRDRFGRASQYRSTLRCGYNCRIAAGDVNLFTGPAINAPIISARCSALIR